MTRTAWAHYMVKHYGQDFNESLAKFDERAKDAGVVKMQVPGEPIRLPVMKAPETVVEHGRTLQARTTSSSRVNSVLEMQEALQEVANVGKDASVLATTSFGDTAAVFRPGAIDGHLSGQPVPFQFGQPAALTTVANEGDFQGPLKRHDYTAEELAKQEEGQQAKKRRTTTGRAKPGLGDVTGQLLEHRKEGYARLDLVLDNYARVKSNTAKKVKDKYKLGEEMAKEVAEWVNEYEDNVKKACQLKESVASWSLGSAGDKLLEVKAVEEDLANLQDKLLGVLEERALRFKQQRKANFEKVQEQNRAKKAAVKPFDTAGHTTLANWLFSKGALVAKHTAPGSKKEEGQRTLTRRASEAAPDKEVVYSKVRVQAKGDNYWDPNGPTLFPADEEGLSKTVGQLRHAYGNKGEEYGQELFRSIDGANTKVASCMKAMPSQGYPADSIELLEWLPEPFRSKEEGPGQLNTFGAGWVVSQRVGVVRYHPDQFPFSAGLGQFLHAVNGPFVVCLFPYGSIKERGCEDLAKAYNWVSSLEQSYFDLWANEHLAYAVMPPGSTLWVPYGYHPVQVATHWATSPPEDINHGVNVMYMQPYMQAKFAQRDWDTELGMEMAKSIAAKYVEKAKSPKWREANDYLAMHARAYMEWVNMVSGAKAQDKLNIGRAIKNAPETEGANDSQKVEDADEGAKDKERANSEEETPAKEE